MYTEECINTFLEKQGQLFPQPVAESFEEAEAFLEDCMAAMVDSIDEVREYLDDMGADVEGMSDGYRHADWQSGWNVYHRCIVGLS